MVAPFFGARTRALVKCIGRNLIGLLFELWVKAGIGIKFCSGFTRCLVNRKILGIQSWMRLNRFGKQA